MKMVGKTMPLNEKGEFAKHTFRRRGELGEFTPYQVSKNLTIHNNIQNGQIQTPLTPPSDVNHFLETPPNSPPMTDREQYTGMPGSRQDNGQPLI